jgi:hypothetical protein
VEADDGQMSAGLQQSRSRRKKPLQVLQLAVDRDPQRLKRPRGRMLPRPMLSPRCSQGAANDFHQLTRRGNPFLLPSPNDVPGNPSRSPILAVFVDQIGQRLLVVSIHYIGSRRR